ncbi:unnamed protein product [Thelazia callipaeda]|uniref:WD repeat-containing protein 44 n=1 Tax=Thelazia callipaeda TaxID=103827 RepID=A0A0N5CYX6_THECL|nr:unnamed protein product [Thelazia callipaeda]
MSFTDVEENLETSASNSDEFEDAQDELRPLPELSSVKTASVSRDSSNSHPSRSSWLPLETAETIDSIVSENSLITSPFRSLPNAFGVSPLRDCGASDRRCRLNALRSRMSNEFGGGRSFLNTNGGHTDDDAGSASESASLASWGRTLLMQAPYTKMKLVYPADTISTKGFPSETDWPPQKVGYNASNDQFINVESFSFLPSSPLPPTKPCHNSFSFVRFAPPHNIPVPHNIPPPLPPRKPSSRLPSALSPQLVDSIIGKKASPTKEVEVNIEPDHTSSVIEKQEKDAASVTNGFARLRGHAKTNSLDRGLSLAKSMKSGPFPPRSDKSSSLKREYSVDSPSSSPYLSFDGGEEDLRNSDAQGIIRQITSSILNEPLREEVSLVESPTHDTPSSRLSSVGEEVACSSSVPTSSAILISNDKLGVNDEKLYKLQIEIPKSADGLKMGSEFSSKSLPVAEELSSNPVSLNYDDPTLNTHIEYADPITRDVERRMSMKGHQHMSRELDDRTSQSVPSLTSFGRAADFVKGYGNYASELFRGAYLKAKTAVSSGSPAKLSKEDDESCNESDHENPSAAEVTSIVRSKNSKKGPFDFDGTRCYQELNNEHTGAVWCMKFSLCGRLLATAGQDNIIRVWVLRNHLTYFNALRDRYNSQSKKISMNMSENVLHDPIQDIENDLRCSSATLGGSVGSSTSQDEENHVETTALMAPKPLCTYRSHTADVLDLSWSRNYFILSSGMDRTVKLWHLSRPECLCCFQHMDFVTCIAFMPKDDRYFLSGSLDGKLRLWHIPDKKVALWNEVEQVKFITAIAFAKNGKFAVVGTCDGRCFFYTTDQLKYHTVIDVRSSRGKNARGHKVTGLAVHGDKLLVTSNDSRIRMYDLRDMALTCKFKGAQNERSQIRASFSPDGKHIVCGSEDRFIYVWTTADLPSSLAVRKDRNDSWQRLRGHSACVTVAIFAPRPQLFLNLLEQRRSGDDKTEQSKSSKNTSDRQIHGDVIISADLSGSIRIFVNRTRIKAGASNFFPTD